MSNMTYEHHLLYSVLGRPASGQPLMARSTKSQHFVLSDGSVLEAIEDRERCDPMPPAKIAARKEADMEDDLRIGIPQFPAVKIRPITLANLEHFKADPSVFQWPSITTDNMVQMCDYTTQENTKAILFIRPTEVAYKARALLSNPVVADNQVTRAAILAEAHQIYYCAAAVVASIQKRHPDERSTEEWQFREFMREYPFDLTELENGSLTAIRTLGITDSGNVDEYVQRELWIVNMTCYDWMLMVVFIYRAVLTALDVPFDFPLFWW